MVSRKPPQNDPLEAARSELARLKDATDWDEPTGRTEVNVTLQAPQPQPSQPQIEVSQPEPSVLKIAFTAVQRLKGWPLAFVIAVLALAFLRWSGKL